MISQTKQHDRKIDEPSSNSGPARPIPSGADPMAYVRPHPPGKPLRDDERAEPPRSDQIHDVDE